MSRRSALLPILLAALVAGCSSEADRAEQARADARAAFARGDLPTVRKALANLRDSRPDTPEALIELTTFMTQAGQAPEAIWLLEEGVARHPDRDDLRVELGRVALIVSNPVLARATVEPVAAESEQHMQALLIRARAEMELGDLEAGLALLEEAQRLYPDSPQAGAFRVSTLLREGRLDEAAAAADELRDAVGDGPEARSFELLAARIQAAQGDDEGAVARVRALVEAQPTDPTALQVLVSLLLSSQAAEEAAVFAQSAVEADPEQAQLWAILAQVDLQRGRFTEAEQAIRSAVERAQTPSSYVLLAQFYQQREQPERAAETFAEAAERFGDVPMLRMHHAESLVELGELERAQLELAAFERESGGDPHAEYLRARIELAHGRASAAAERLGRVVSRLDRSYTQYWLGRALEDTGDLTGAERRYGLALLRGGANPAPAVALLALANRRGDWPAVGRRALQLIQRAPGVSAGYETGVTAFVRSGEAEPAVKLARLYRERFPASVKGPALLALALRARGELAEAESVLLEARERFGADPQLESERAMLLGTRGRFDEAVALLEETRAAHPDTATQASLADDAMLQASLAALHFGADRREAGSAATERAMALAPDDPAPLKLRARYLASRGALEQARADCARYLELRPRDAAVHFIHGAVLAGLGRADAAAAAYRRAIELDENAFEARNNLALLLAEQGDLPGGIEVAQKAYALADANPHVIDTLGFLYLEKGLAERAVALLEKAHAAAPDLPGPQLHLALAYHEVERDDAARALLVALLERVDSESEMGTQARAALRSLGE